MKKILLAAVLLVAATSIFAQEMKPSYFGIKLGMNSSTNTYDPTVYAVETGYKSGFAGGIYYNWGLGEAFSIQPEVLYSEMGSKITAGVTDPKALATLKLNYISVPILFKFTPSWRVGIFVGPQFDFLSSAKSFDGAQGSVDQKNKIKSSDIAATGGLEVWLTEHIGLYGRYIWGFNDINNNFNLYPNVSTTSIKNRGWQFGLTIGFRHKVPAPVVMAPPPPPPPVDTDKDGIPDDADKCPTVPGVAKYNGCPIPDTDKDGINDEQDKCPTVPGVAKYQGCPIPDTDGDGINDEEDKCPTVPGVSRYQGCPIPDTDGDGINDEEDKCPNRPGVASNFGCPEITFYYKRAVAALSAADKKSLDSIVRFMNANPTLNVIIEGYTSTLGAEKYNQKLSEQRASNAVKYLISKGIDKGRLTSVGFGETRPVEGSDQSKEAGRAVNRRTIMRINTQ
jgi:outer membrane protein OmpA-like peptidoglycan-associated protein/opacity protein-like surface antigen